MAGSYEKKSRGGYRRFAHLMFFLGLFVVLRHTMVTMCIRLFIIIILFFNLLRYTYNDTKKYDEAYIVNELLTYNVLYHYYLVFLIPIFPKKNYRIYDFFFKH
jgi:hypothetical protein